MSVFRVIKDKDNPYVMVNKYYIYDNRLSLKAKGLMSYFLSRPDDWNFYIEEIKKHTIDKDTSISGAIKELIESGYIRREARRGDKGKFKGGYDYSVYEIPIVSSNEENIASTENLPKLENPESGKSRIGKMPSRENQGLLNNKSKLNNKLLTNNSNCSSDSNMEVFKKFEKCGFGLLSSVVIEKLTADIERFGADWVIKAVEKADEAGKHRYDYVKGILENWKTNGGVKEKQRGGKINGSSRKNNVSGSSEEVYNFSRFGCKGNTI